MTDIYETIEYRGYDIQIIQDSDACNPMDGDCYGYQVVNQDGDDIDDGSCWGFIGSDHEKSGLLYYAHNAIDCQCRRDAKLKSLAESVTIMKGLGL